MKKMLPHIILPVLLALSWLPAAAAEGAGSAPLGQAAGGLSGETATGSLRKDAVGKKLDASLPRRMKCRFVDPKSREYVVLLAGYGGLFPITDYGLLYRPANLVSVTAGIYYINFMGFSPELHFRHAPMKSNKDPLMYSSRITLNQVFPAIVYRHAIPLRRNVLTIYGRIWDGITILDFDSRDPYIPVLKRKIRETINTFGFSVGCYYDAWKGLLVGIDMGYGIVFTAGTLLQSITFTVTAGVRIF